MTTNTPVAAGSGAAPTIQNAGMNPLLSMLMPMLVTKGSANTQTGGTGDVAGLQQLLAALMPTTQAGGMNPVLQAIFQEGFQKQMPAIYNASNQAGLRPGSTTQQQLLVNDLAARMSAEGAKAVNQQQQTAAQVAGSIAANTKAPVSTVQKDTSGVNTKNLLPALLAVGALGAYQKTKEASSAKKGLPKDTTPGIASDAGGLIDVITSIFSPNSTSSGTMGSNIPAASTGGIAGNNFGGSPTPSFSRGNSVADAGANYAFNTGLNAVSPELAIANMVAQTLGINEITQPIAGITGGISDAISGAASGVGDVVSSVWKGVTGGCYITTAVCELDGKPDNAHELEVLREFRDSWLAAQPAGNELIQQYYKEAPKFLESLKLHPQRTQILETFRDSYILPAVHAVETGNNMEAFKLYVAMLEKANSFIQ